MRSGFGSSAGQGFPLWCAKHAYCCTQNVYKLGVFETGNAIFFGLWSVFLLWRANCTKNENQSVLVYLELVRLKHTMPCLGLLGVFVVSHAGNLKLRLDVGPHLDRHRRCTSTAQTQFCGLAAVIFFSWQLTGILHSSTHSG